MLDYCITQNIDVVNLSLGTPQHSGLVSQKIEQARHAGVACIAAAGNSAGPVSFPASLPSVLAVAAIGKTGEFPPESYHNTQMYGPPTYGGYFSAKFTCYGPQVDVCAPGVAIVSCVPPRNYAAYDGTSVASSYVTARPPCLWHTTPTSVTASSSAPLPGSIDSSSSFATAPNPRVGRPRPNRR